MFLIISSFITIILILFLWILLISCNKSKTDEEIFIEDNLQMQYLKEFSLKNKIN